MEVILLSKEKLKEIIDSIEKIRGQFHSVGGDGMPLIEVLDGDTFQQWRSLVQFEMQNLKNDDFTQRIIQLTDSFNGWNDKSVFAELVSKLITIFENYDLYSTERKGELTNVLNNKVFIVHGHNEALKERVARLLEKQKIEVIILHEQANEGKTIIEKIEKHSDVDAAIVLFTADDIGGKIENDLKSRARQNVVYEAGYFAGKLGRNRVIIINNVEEMPSDLSGIVYTPASNGWENAVLKELRAIGFNIDMNNI